MSFFVYGQRCVGCHQELTPEEVPTRGWPHSLQASTARDGVRYAHPEHCPVCVSDAKQMQLEHA